MLQLKNDSLFIITNFYYFWGKVYIFAKMSSTFSKNQDLTFFSPSFK